MGSGSGFPNTVPRETSLASPTGTVFEALESELMNAGPPANSLRWGQYWGLSLPCESQSLLERRVSPKTQKIRPGEKSLGDHRVGRSSRPQRWG